MAFGSADVAKLVVDLSLKGNFVSQLSKVNSSLAKTNAKIDATSSRAYKAGQQIGTGIKAGAVIAAAGIGVLVSQVGFGLNSLIDLEQATTQTNAVLKSTGNAAGQTAKSIRDLAEKYESLNATIDDKVIQSGENVLLTFTNIRKNAFEPALRAALDLSVAMHQDLQQSIIQVGKALNDPLTGLTALRRIGVQFSPVQEDMIKGFFRLTKEENKHYLALYKTNKGQAAAFLAAKRASGIQKAQTVILAELNKEFGGSFLAGGQTTAAKVAKFGDAIEDLQRSLATALLPAVSNTADALNTLLRDPEVIRATEKLGEDIGKIFSKDNINKGIAALRSGFGVLKEAAGVIASIVSTAVGAFTSLPEPLQKLLVGGFVANKLTGGLITNIFGGLAETIGKSLGIIKAPLVNVQGGVVKVNGPGGPGGPSGKGGGNKPGLDPFTTAVAAAAGLGLAAAWKSTFQDPALQGQTDAIDKNTQAQIDNKVPLADLQKSLDATKEGIYQLSGKGNPLIQALSDVLYGGQTDALKATQAALEAEIAARMSVPGPGLGAGKGSGQHVEAVRGAMADRLSSAEIGRAAATGVKQGIGPDIEAMRGAIAKGLTPPGKTQDDTDIVTALQAHIVKFVPTVKLDPTQITDLRTTSPIDGEVGKTIAKSTDIETMRGAIADGLVTTQGTVASAGSTAADAARAAGSQVAGAIASKDLSINQSIDIKVNVSAAGVTKSVTVQNRAGPGSGSANDDFRGGKPAGGL